MDGPADMAKESEEVRTGKMTVEEVLKTAPFVLYSGIIKNTVDAITSDGVKHMFYLLADSIGEEAAANIMSTMSVIMVYYAQTLIPFYDDLLKDEINNQLNPMINQINRNSADITAFNSVVQVLRKNTGEMEKAMLLHGWLKPVEHKEPATETIQVQPQTEKTEEQLIEQPE
jgi:hypothetical protein